MSFFKKPDWAAADSKDQEKDTSTFYRRSEYVYADILAHTNDPIVEETGSDGGSHEEEEEGGGGGGRRRGNRSQSPASSQFGAADGRTFSSPSSLKRQRLSGSIGSDFHDKSRDGDDDEYDGGPIDIESLKKSTRVSDTFGVGMKARARETGEKSLVDSTPSTSAARSSIPNAGAPTITNRPSVTFENESPEPIVLAAPPATAAASSAAPKPRLPGYDDDDDDDEEDDESDEELAELARVARERARRGITSGSYARHQSPNLFNGPASSVPSSTRSGEPAEEDLVVHILVESDIPDTSCLLVARKLSQNLGDVRRTWCLRQNMDEDAARKIFLTWEDKRVFDVTTCKGLGISQNTPFPEAMEDVDLPDDGGVGIYAHMKAYTEELFEQYKMKKQRRLLGDDVDDYLEAAGHDDTMGETQKPSHPDAKQISIRAPGVEEVDLRVVPQTSIAVIVAALRQARDVAEEKTITLTFDGERLDEMASIGDYDIEDEDCIDAIIR